MKKSASDILLQLLSIALGNSKTCSLPDEINWQEVMMLAERQGVMGVAFDGIQKVSEFQKVSHSTGSGQAQVSSGFPDMDTLMDWLGQTSYIETIYEQYVDAIRKLASTLSDQGLKVLLLKGYGCSLNYPNPSHRPCGDIDIFVMNDKGSHKMEYVRFAEQLLQTRLGSDVTFKNSHHSQLQFHGFTVENHLTILDTDAYKSSIALNNLLVEEAAHCINLIDDATGICLPSANFNAIHLLRHMASDFATVNTTLRHVLDWSTFVVSHDVDWDFVHKVAHKSNMNRFLDVINGICVSYLGYPSELFPVEVEDVALRNRVLADIIQPEFADEIPPMNNKLAYGFAKTRRMWKNRWKHRIVYDESLLESFVTHAKNRLKANG